MIPDNFTSKNNNFTKIVLNFGLFRVICPITSIFVSFVKLEGDYFYLSYYHFHIGSAS